MKKLIGSESSNNNYHSKKTFERGGTADLVLLKWKFGNKPILNKKGILVCDVSNHIVASH